MPKVPTDLKKHDCILYTLLSSGNVWSFKDLDVAVHGRFRVNTPDGIRTATLDGLGIAYSPVWLFEDALLDPRPPITDWSVSALAHRGSARVYS